jgi:hypothetical protein
MKRLTSHEAVIASSLMAGAMQAATIQAMIQHHRRLVAAAGKARGDHDAARAGAWQRR